MNRKQWLKAAAIWAAVILGLSYLAATSVRSLS